MKYDVVCFGNAIVDILAFVDDDFLAQNNLYKGSMNLVDFDYISDITAKLNIERQISGGSAANTAVGVAKLGGNAGFIGKVSGDDFGKIFAKDIQGAKVDASLIIKNNDMPTARCIVLVSSDGQRTMLTYLGAAGYIKKQDVNYEMIKNSKVLYFEGYLWDRDDTKESILESIRVAKQNGVKIALSLSDLFCVDRFRDEFKKLLKDVDILFANIDEAKSLWQVETNEEAINLSKDICDLFIITKAAEGATIIENNKISNFNANKVKVVDTTGAGDLFAAGMLYGLTKDKNLDESAKHAIDESGAIIEIIGARA